MLRDIFHAYFGYISQYHWTFTLDNIIGWSFLAGWHRMIMYSLALLCKLNLYWGSGGRYPSRDQRGWCLEGMDNHWGSRVVLSSVLLQQLWLVWGTMSNSHEPSEPYQPCEPCIPVSPNKLYDSFELCEPHKTNEPQSEWSLMSK